MKKIVCALFLLLVFETTFGQLLNGGFEQWDSVEGGSCYDTELTQDFNISDPKEGKLQNWFYEIATSTNTCGVVRTTDSYSGEYAVVLYNWYNYVYGQLFYEEAISNRPDYFEGQFKSDYQFDESLERGGFVDVVLTKFNGTTHDTIATGKHVFKTSKKEYTYFQIPLEYRSSETPDKAHIHIKNANSRCESNGGFSVMVCNPLYLDDLKFTGTSLSTNTIFNNRARLFFSNPISEDTEVRSSIELHNATLELYDISGRVIDRTKNINGKNIPLVISGIENGVYLVNLIQDNKFLMSEKIIVKR